MSQQRADASLRGCCACYAASLHLAPISDHSVNSQESHSKTNSSARKPNLISGYENLSSRSCWEYWRQLLAKKMTFSFQGTAATFYRQISSGFCVAYQKLSRSVHFWLSYSIKNRVAFLRHSVHYGSRRHFRVSRSRAGFKGAGQTGQLPRGSHN